MYFIPLIRDYIELLNNVYDSFSGDINFQKIFQESFIFLLQNIKFIFLYIISFEWFRDFFYLPVLIPQISDSILKENFFLEVPLSNIFNFLETSSYSNNKIFVGFFNSFFLSLPFSCSHLICIRQLLIQGNKAGFCAGLGKIFGQIFFISSVLFGFRFLVIPWFSFEPFLFLFGVFLLLNNIYDSIHERTIKILDWKNRNELLKIFFFNFVLMWIEQTCIFQYLGNLTVDTKPTSLEILTSSNELNFFVNHFNYIFGLLIGSLFFNFIIALLLKKLSEIVQTRFFLLKSTWIIRLNLLFLTSILAFTFTSIPYYGLDFLITGPLGFISQDRGLETTIFSQKKLKDPFNVLGDNFSIYLDNQQFDRGVYLKPPILETFEDLNYSADYALTIEQGKIDIFNQYKEKAKKIREILIKKKESKTENQKEDSVKNMKTNLKKVVVDEEKFLEYPTYSLESKTNFISSKIRTRFDFSYKESPAYVFDIFLRYSLNKVFSKDQYSIIYPEIEKKIKQRFYANPIFKFLLNVDIDNLLKKQPSSFFLSPNQEKQLYKKRLMLSRYYDTLRIYKALPYVNTFQYLFNGSKSFADRVYNQQFKGTLRVVRKLFSISYQSKEKPQQNIILKYDQFNYKKINSDFSFWHEELKTTLNNKKPFMELVSQAPLYLGWDDNLKKITITNRFLPKSTSSYIKNYPTENQNVLFSTWPLMVKDLNEQELINKSLFYTDEKTIQTLNYINLLSLFKQEYKKSGISSYKTLPSNITKIASDIIEVTPPNRGGFIWPGNKNLKISFDNFFNRVL